MVVSAFALTVLGTAYEWLQHRAGVTFVVGGVPAELVAQYLSAEHAIGGVAGQPLLQTRVVGHADPGKLR